MTRLSTLLSSFPKFGHVGASIASNHAWNPMLFVAATPRPIQIPISHQDLKQGQGASETVNAPTDQSQEKAFSTNQPIASSQGASDSNMPFSVTVENMQDKAFSTAQHVSNKTKDVAGQASVMTRNMTEKAKQTMQEAWDSTKNTAQKAANNVLGQTHSTKDIAQKVTGTIFEKAQESTTSIKDNVEAVKQSMNTKNKN